MIITTMKAKESFLIILEKLFISAILWLECVAVPVLSMIRLLSLEDITVNMQMTFETAKALNTVMMAKPFYTKVSLKTELTEERVNFIQTEDYFIPELLKMVNIAEKEIYTM